MKNARLTDSAEISDSDFQHLKVCIKSGKIGFFIQAFEQKSPYLSAQNIVALGLTELIKKDEILLSNDLLKILYIDDELKPSVFTTVDKSGKNAILYALERGTSLTALASYIFDLDEQGKITEKLSMDIELMKKMKDAVMYPLSDIHPAELMEQLLEPLYTEEAIDSLTTLIGQEWLDSYYI